MGIKLVEEVLNYAPPNLTASERLLLVVIAQNANDKTRIGYPGMDTIAYRTGMKPESVQKTLKRLADKGIDLRVPRGTGKDGRVVYAAPGRQTTYAVPNLPLSPDHCPPIKASKPGPPSEEWADGGPDMGGPPSAKGGPPSGMGGPPSGPSPHISSGSPQGLLKTTPPPPEGERFDSETELVEAEIVNDDKPWLSDDYWTRPGLVNQPSGYDPWAR